MESVTAVIGWIKFAELILKSIAHYRITSTLPDDQLATAFAENAGDEFIGTLSERIKNKAIKLFGKEPTMQEKLDAIIESSFNKVNEKYNDKFTAFPDYVEKKNINIKTQSDMLTYIQIWAKDKSSVFTITQDERRNFVKDFYQRVSACIDRDEALKAHIATLRTYEGVKLLMADMEELKCDMANMSVPQNIDTARIELAEDSLKQLLDAIKQNSMNRIDIDGDDCVARNIQQSSENGSNSISIVGNGNTIEGIVQK